MTTATDPSTRTAPADQPIPFTLTAKAHAALDQDPAAPGPGEWGCDRCGAAFFGAPPGDGLCPACRPAGAEP